MPSMTPSVQEELAVLNGMELLAASNEVSKPYNGIVLLKLVGIVQCKVRCYSLHGLAVRMGVQKNTLYRWASGKPIAQSLFERAVREFAFFLSEAGT